MRNLKKVLSLSLALVMLLGMMVIGGSAATALVDYSDADSINETYKEAVDLLTAIEVLQGDEGGFRPTDTLTREEAAKIVATVALGVDAAEALTVTKAPFTDVAATRWSAGYISYCANVGIIDGMGDGTFRPTETVTGYQMAKMLLCVLGYGVNGEYTGSNWSLNVARDGTTTNLFTRLTNIGNFAITREETAQLAFNTVTANLVTYSELLGTYSAYNNNIIIGGRPELLGTIATNIFRLAANVEPDEYGFNYRTWRYTYAAGEITDSYPIDVILGTVTSGSMGAMYKAYAWDDATIVWENGVTGEQNDVDLGNMNIPVVRLNNGTDVNAVASTAFRNENANVVTYTGQTVYVVDSGEIWGDNNASIINNGAADKLIVVTSYLAEVTRVNAANATRDRNVNVSVYVPNATFTGNNILTATIETEDYEVGDYILVDPHATLDQVLAANRGTAADLTAMQTAFGADVCGSETAEVISAANISAYYTVTANENGSVTTGGTRYNYNGIFNVNVAAANAPFHSAALGADMAEGDYTLRTGTYNFYLDQNGNVIGVNVVEDSIDDYAYIAAVGEDPFKRDNIVTAILSDGTVGTYTVSAQSGHNYADNDPTAVNADKDIYDQTPSVAYAGMPAADDDDGLAENVGYIYAYSFDANGDIVLTALDNSTGRRTTYENTVAAINAQNISFTKGYTAIVYQDNSNNNKVAYATEDTVFIYRNGASVTRYVGMNNAPSINNNNVQISIAVEYRNNNQNIAYAEYVVINTAPIEVGTEYLYLLDETYWGWAYDSNNNPVYYFRAVLNGEQVNIATTAQRYTIGLHTYTVNSSVFAGDTANSVIEGAYTLGTFNFANSYVANDVTVISGGVLVIGNGYLAQTNPDLNNAQVILSDTTKVVNLSTGRAVADTVDVGDAVQVVYGLVGGLKFAETVYITEASTVMTSEQLVSALTSGIVTAGRYTVYGDLALGTTNVTIPANTTVYVTGSVTGTGTLTVNGEINVAGSIANVTVGATGTVNAGGNIGEVTANAGTINVLGNSTITTLTACGNIVVGENVTLTVADAASAVSVDTITGNTGAKVVFSGATQTTAGNSYYSAKGTAPVAEPATPGTAGTAVNTNITVNTFAWDTVYTDTAGTTKTAWLQTA